MQITAKQSKKRRSQNLNDAAIAKIVSIIDGFSGRITYAIVISEIELQLKRCYTRQALFRHERIRLAFETKRKMPEARAGNTKKLSSIKKMEAEIVSRLRSENARLQAENEALLQQFVRWAYNAFVRGLDETYLNQPLPTIDRGRSIKKSEAG